MRRNFSIKRIVSLLIAVLMVVSIMPAAFAEEAALENETFMTPEQAQAINLPAFPGAEGGGRYYNRRKRRRSVPRNKSKR